MDDSHGRRFIGDIAFFDREHDLLFSRFDGPEWELKLIMVERRYRMQGIGRSLIEHIADTLDLNDISLYTDDDCDCAFYTRFDHEVLATNRFHLNGRSGWSYAYIVRM
jgi:GNAT superfamily N-acetyltransferase